MTFTSSRAASRLARVQWGIVTLMVAFSVMSYFDRTIMSIAGPGIIKEFSLTETEMGSVYSAFVLSYAILMIPGGWLADRLGPWRVLTAMGFGAGLFTALTALGGKPGLGALLGVVPSFLIIRLGLGVSTAPLYPSCGRMNANWYDLNKRARIWGLVAAGAGIGSATSPLLFTWMIARYGWRFSFLLSGVATAALTAIWVWYARDHPSQHPALNHLPSDALPRPVERKSVANPGRTPWRRLLSDRNLVLLFIGYFTVAYFEYIFFFWIYYYFGQIRHVGPAETALYTSSTMVAWTVMTPLGGWLSDRLAERLGHKIGRRLVPLACLTTSAILLVVGINLSSPAAGAAVLALSFGFAASTDGPFWACAIDVGGKYVGAAGGMLNTGGNLGGFFAPVVTPFIAHFFGWSASLYVGSVIMAAGAALWLGIDPTKRIDE